MAGVFTHRLGVFNQSSEYDYFNITPTRGFSAYKYAPSGTVGGDILDYDVGDGNSSFNAATGEWTAADSGIHLLMFSGFPEAGKSSGERNQFLYIDGVAQNSGTTEYHGTRDFANYNGSGSSANFAALFDVTAGEVYNFAQNNLDRAEYVHFSSVYLPSTEIAGEFHAYKNPQAGTANAVITSYTTEFFDPDAAFNASTGVYTAPATGTYLFAIGGFPDNGTGVLHGVTLMVNGSSSGLAIYEDLLSTGTMGKRPVALVLVELTASDTVSLRQDGVIAGTVVFSGCQLVSPTAYFSARRGTASGSAGDTIAGWTEDFDVGANFNATTGEFTAPDTATWVFSFYGHNDGSATDETQIRALINGAVIHPDGAIPGVAAREFLSAKNHTANHVLSLTLRLRAGDTLELAQISDAMANCYFCGFKVDW